MSFGFGWDLAGSGRGADCCRAAGGCSSICLRPETTNAASAAATTTSLASLAIPVRRMRIDVSSPFATFFEHCAPPCEPVGGVLG